MTKPRIRTGVSRRRLMSQAASLGVLAAATPSMIARRVKAANGEVRIGFVLPLTGPFAEAGQHQRHAVEMAIEDINAQGGVHSLGGAQLVPVFGSFQTDVADANTETERLISQENVVGLIGPYLSGAAIAGTVIAERARIPYLVPNALADEITERGLSFAFKSVPHVSQFATDAAQLVRDLSEKSGEQPATCCLVRTDNFFGNVVGERFAEHLPRYDFTMLADVTYPQNPTSMEDVILRLMQEEPEVVFAAGEPAQVILLFQQLNELNYWPKMGWVGVGGGYSNPVTRQNLGDLMEGVLLVNDWFPDIARPGSQELNERFKERVGTDLLGNTNTTYAGVWIFYHAIEAAGSTDPVEIRDALASLELDEGVPMFMYERVAFDENGFMRYASNVAAQIQDDEARVIWPDSLAVGEAIWPYPHWDDRG